MFRKNCGKEIDPNAAICVNCGFAKNTGSQFCSNCGQPVTPGAVACMNCGYALQAPMVGEQKSKLVAILLALFLGGIGIHDFYLGYNKFGVIKIVLAVCTLGSISSIWAFIDFIRLLVGNIDRDANGVELKKEF